MAFNHVKVVSEVYEPKFEEQFEKAIDELSSRVKKVTFSTAADQVNEYESEVYYTAFIEHQ